MLKAAEALVGTTIDIDVALFALTKSPASVNRRVYVFV
jgi:hypothetical protein